MKGYQFLLGKISIPKKPKHPTFQPGLISPQYSAGHHHLLHNLALTPPRCTNCSKAPCTIRHTQCSAVVVEVPMSTMLICAVALFAGFFVFGIVALAAFI